MPSNSYKHPVAHAAGALLLLALATGCTATEGAPTDAGLDSGPDASVDAQPNFDTAVDAKPRNPFGAYNFTIDDRVPSSQLTLLKSVGYQGVVTEWKGESAHLAFANDQTEIQGAIELTASIVGLNIDSTVDRNFWSTTLGALKSSQTLPWVLVFGAKTSVASIADRVREVAVLANQMGTTLVLYPHWMTAIETAEESVEIIRRANIGNIKTSLHLCHELKAGNRDRLADVVAATLPYLSLASINGAYTTGYEEQGWDRTITPLDEGDFDVQESYLRPLIESGYAGPILLHTFGIKAPPEQHYARSFAAYSAMRRSLGLSAAQAPQRGSTL